MATSVLLSHAGPWSQHVFVTVFLEVTVWVTQLLVTEKLPIILCACKWAWESNKLHNVFFSHTVTLWTDALIILLCKSGSSTYLWLLSVYIGHVKSTSIFHTVSTRRSCYTQLLCTHVTVESLQKLEELTFKFNLCVSFPLPVLPPDCSQILDIEIVFSPYHK